MPRKNFTKPRALTMPKTTESKESISPETSDSKEISTQKPTHRMTHPKTNRIYHKLDNTAAKIEYHVTEETMTIPGAHILTPGILTEKFPEDALPPHYKGAYPIAPSRFEIASIIGDPATPPDSQIYWSNPSEYLILKLKKNYDPRTKSYELTRSYDDKVTLIKQVKAEFPADAWTSLLFGRTQTLWLTLELWINNKDKFNPTISDHLHLDHPTKSNSKPKTTTTKSSLCFGESAIATITPSKTSAFSRVKASPHPILRPSK